MEWRRRREITSTVIRSYLPFKSDTPVPLPRGVSVGRHTYGYDADTFPIFTECARIVVGAFCCIGPEVRLHGGGQHVLGRVTTFPLNALLFDRAKRNAKDDVDMGPTVIGNDVWIGHGATVLAGVTVGDGAVLGARTVVSKAVAPYAVVVGNPARIIGYRFESGIRERLLALRWWDWSDEEIRAREPWFMGGVESFLEEVERLNGSRPNTRRGAARRRTTWRPLAGVQRNAAVTRDRGRALPPDSA
jgi:chloramphenicol O-acetyltransferase type B